MAAARFEPEHHESEAQITTTALLNHRRLDTVNYLKLLYIQINPNLIANRRLLGALDPRMVTHWCE